MASSITTTSTTQTAVPAHKVWLRENWAEAWVEEPFLYCDAAAIRAAPEKSSAVLHYGYGWISQPPGGDDPVYYAPLEIEHWYVKIEIDWVNADGETQPLLWYGIVYDRDDDAFGSVNQPPAGSGAGSGPQLSGRQKFTCYGMEVLLERETLRGSTILLANGAEVELRRPLGFNFTGTRSEDPLTPNMSVAVGSKGAHLFATDLTTAIPWNTERALNYLLLYRSPKDPNGLVQIPWQVDPLLADTVPDWDWPRIEVKTETLKELIDHRLLSRKRLVSYCVTVNESEEENGDDFVQLEPFSFTATGLAFATQYPNPNGTFTPWPGSIAANSNQVSLDFSQAYDVQVAALKKVGQERYDQVIVRGARKTSTFTVSWLDATLGIDWDAVTLEPAYKTAASTESDYPSQRAAQRNWRNRLFRSADKFKRVYRWFAVPQLWDGYVDDGENSGTKSAAFPVDDEPDVNEIFYRPGQLFRRHLPLYKDRDYSGANIADGTITGAGIGGGSGSGGAPEFLEPMAFLKITSPQGEGWGSGSGSGLYTGPRYQHVEKLSECAKTDKYALGGSSFTCSLRMQDRNLGIEVNVHGAAQHAIALGSDFGSGVDYSDSPPILDFTNNLLATVSCDFDGFVEQVWPIASVDEPDDPADDTPPGVETDVAEEEPQVADVCRTLLIDLSHLEHGNGCRLDYVCPGTVVGISDGILQRSEGGYVRDDRGRLQAIAQVAWQWYQQERNVFTLKYAQIDGQFKVGMLVTTIGPAGATQQVNTPITSIEWDLVSGTTTIQTGFAELDFNSLL